MDSKSIRNTLNIGLCILTVIIFTFIVTLTGCKATIKSELNDEISINNTTLFIETTKEEETTTFDLFVPGTLNLEKAKPKPTETTTPITVLQTTTQTPDNPQTQPVTEPITQQPETQNNNANTQSGTPLANHGSLSISGTQLVDKNGATFVMRGISTHGLSWFPDYVNYDLFKQMRDEWNVNVVRFAMYTAEYNGYCTGDWNNRETLKKLIDDGVKYANELGLYVIIDWHILSDSNPNNYKNESLEFFREMSAKYAGYQNVIYEICNEPNGGIGWGEIKSYAVDVINTIRSNDSDAIIIVGTPTWSQDVDIAAGDKINASNIMYAMHFYADTHRDYIREKLVTAINNGLPVIISEFGICDASGNGGINYDEASKWMSLLNQYSVSYIMWNMSNKSETCAMIQSWCNKNSGFSYDELSDAGKWFVNLR